MTTSSRAQARHRSAAANQTMNALSSSMATGVRRYRRRSAVIAASSGLVVTMGLPAAAVSAQAEEPVEAPASAPAAPVESTTAVIAVAPTAEVDLGMGGTASVDSSEAERIEAEAAAAEAARVAAEQAAAQQAEAEAAAARSSATSTALASRSASTQTSRSVDRSSTSSAPVTAPVVTQAATGSGAGASALAIAQRYAGVPYVYGGSTPSGFDCSGLVQFAFRQAGVSLPRVASAQSGAGRRVSASEARPGDLVSFTGSGGVYHIGIYAGNGQMVDAPRPGKGVALRSIWSSSVFFTRVG